MLMVAGWLRRWVTAATTRKASATMARATQRYQARRWGDGSQHYEVVMRP